MEDATMFQCHLCEDWFHRRCMDNVPDEESFEDFICKECIHEHDFLTGYLDSPLFHFAMHSSLAGDALPLKRKGLSEDEDPVEDDLKKTRLELPDLPDPIYIASDGPKMEEKGKERADCEQKPPRSPSCKLDGKGTVLRPLFTVILTYQTDLLKDPLNYNLFLSEGWKDELCRCSSCITTHYLSIPFITLPKESSDDSFEPEPDAEATLSLLELGMKQLTRMDRPAALEGVRAYKEMADSIKAFLKDFADEGKVVTSEDVYKFFDRLKEEALQKSSSTSSSSAKAT
ncbi:hypothetical protein HDU97_002851 [Phlyctochytrium planicorne]|nr:hypothetical protein HDU97_002851 [Phlyctochytrium planicorne]